MFLAGCTCDCDDEVLPQAKTLTLQPGTEGKDASIFSCIPCGYNTKNYGSTADFLATAWTNGGNTSNIRSLLQFDLSSIPSSATVTSAKLSLYYKTSASTGDHSGSNESYVRKVISSWDESTVTWDNQPSLSTAGQLMLSKSTSATQDFVDIDVTDLVRDWVAAPSSNFGLMMLLQNESPYRQLAFASGDHTESAKRPKLVIDYKE